MFWLNGGFLSPKTFNIITAMLRHQKFAYITITRYRQLFTAHLPIRQCSQNVLAEWWIRIPENIQHHYSYA
jgi:hypothetical protein